jgi:hypothetical protein
MSSEDIDDRGDCEDSEGSEGIDGRGDSDDCKGSEGSESSVRKARAVRVSTNAAVRVSR